MACSSTVPTAAVPPGLRRHVALFADAGSPTLAALVRVLGSRPRVTVHVAHCNLASLILPTLGYRGIKHTIDWTLADRFPAAEHLAALDAVFQEPWFEALALSDTIVFAGVNFRINRVAQAVRTRALSTGVRCVYVDCALPTVAAPPSTVASGGPGSRACAASETAHRPWHRTIQG